MRGTNFFRRNGDVEVTKEELIEKTQEKKEIENRNIVNKQVEKRTFTNNTKYDQKTIQHKILDTEVIGYVIDNFPTMAVEIKNSLINLYNTLEDTIDHIEDSSSYIVKAKRDFELSEEYRKTSIKIYNIGQDIDKYVEWMDHKNKKLKEGFESSNEKENISFDKEVAVTLDEFENGIKIYEDFSLKEPKSFKIKDKVVEVENWDDLLVKTAEVLIKNYKKNKYDTEIFQEDIKICNKKSQQNTFRDTVIEMLNEYRISLDEFEVEVIEKERR